MPSALPPRCISYYSYIKPQLHGSMGERYGVVYRTIPTSNHNVIAHYNYELRVVYRTIPTSNHNIITDVSGQIPLYIVLFLHQTTTSFPQWFVGTKLYIVLFLHQTTTKHKPVKGGGLLYIVLFLHQTTTLARSYI